MKTLRSVGEEKCGVSAGWKQYVDQRVRWSVKPKTLELASHVGMYFFLKKVWSLTGRYVCPQDVKIMLKDQGNYEAGKRWASQTRVLGAEGRCLGSTIEGAGLKEDSMWLGSSFLKEVGRRKDVLTFVWADEKMCKGCDKKKVPTCTAYTIAFRVTH